MFDPLDFEKRPLLTRLLRKRKLAALTLFLENCFAGLWRISAWVAFFAGLWLLQLPSVAGTYGPPAAFLIFIAGLVYLLREDGRLLHWPAKGEIDRRLELESGLAHRPINALEDKLVNPKKEPTRALWQKSQEEAAATIRLLRVPKPRAILAKADPVALRSFAMLLLIIGVIIAGPQWQERISYGLFPFSFSRSEEKPSPVTLWITPPEYTAMPQIVLEGRGRSRDTLKIPEGSVIKVRVNDSFIQPELRMGETVLKLEQFGDKSWGIETEITQGERLILKEWILPKADIAYDYIIDQPPLISVAGDVETLTKGELRIPLKVLDDYGMTDLTMRLALDPMIEDKPLGRDYEESRAVMSPPATELEFNPVYDLSWHPWAGLPVIITLEGIDHKGQRATAEPLKLALPERGFNHPVAQQLIAMRKRLIWTPEEAATNVAHEIHALLNTPDQFRFDTVVTLALRSAVSRLLLDSSPQAVARIVELLWDTALRIEEGDLPMALRNLQEAQRNLEQILKNPDAGDEEVARAMQELREALAEYFEEMFREMQKRMVENGQQNQMQIPPEMFQMINPDDIASFLDQLQSEALSGDRDAAREMLSQLQQFMDMLDPSTEMTMPPQMQFMMEGINEMQELIEKQQALRDQTQAQCEGGKAGSQYPPQTPFDGDMPDLGDMPPAPVPPVEGGTPAIDTQQNKVEQDALRYILGQLMLETDEQLGEIPENMGLAEQEMRGSADWLGQNQPEQSLPHQDKAIEYLQQAMKDMSQQLQQMMQQMTMLSFGSGSRFDPLGRPMSDGDQPGFFPGSRVKIPDEAERKRVQEILKTLRQRSGEIERPDYELEYYRRLMKQF